MNARYFSVFASAGLLLLSACSNPFTKPDDEAAATVSTPDEVAAPMPMPTPTANPGYNPDEQFLLSQNPNAYTIQVLSAQNPQTVTNFMQRYAGYSFKQIQSNSHGQSQYVLFYGVYGSKQEAQQAARMFGDTWVRPLRDVQAQISGSKF